MSIILVGILLWSQDSVKFEPMSRAAIWSFLGIKLRMFNCPPQYSFRFARRFPQHSGMINSFKKEILLLFWRSVIDFRTRLCRVACSSVVNSPRCAFTFGSRGCYRLGLVCHDKQNSRRTEDLVNSIKSIQLPFWYCPKRLHCKATEWYILATCITDLYLWTCLWQHVLFTVPMWWLFIYSTMRILLCTQLNERTGQTQNKARPYFFLTKR